jgi:pantoate--beta-alanine ligase
MDEVTAVSDLRDRVGAERCEGHSIGLVPTMGYLHDGHLALLRRARAENDLVVLSIFVNPTQFGSGEDLDRYPRDLVRDRSLAEGAEVDVLFVPHATEMYPRGADVQTVWVDPGTLDRQLEGATRPGHFRGVATVVAKLFNVVEPDRAYFGQKDAQQAVILQRMVDDLAFPVQITVVRTVREPDGLALSSRNVYLSDEERRQAAALFEALKLAGERIVGGEREATALEVGVREHINRRAPLAVIDFVQTVDLYTLQPVSRVEDDALLALAALFGQTRLIDNLMIRFGSGRPVLSL